jgi:FlaA1/EpsC-like NDP-sugar epimerase
MLAGRDPEERMARVTSQRGAEILPASEAQALSILGRERRLFATDLEEAEAELSSRVRNGSFLVLGGGGSIGQAVVRALFHRRPGRLHVVDLSENNLVELVRDLRSSCGYIEGDFQTLPLDCGALEFDRFLASQPAYDFVLNLTALKHVRSEKDPFTLMRMVGTNVLNTERTLRGTLAAGAARYFAVSSDKAANPANAMGATKRAMELCLLRASDDMEVCSARFANVAFSDGSLLHGFTQRLAKRQPLSAPQDVRRYFITAEESATLCLMACLLGDNRDCYFPVPQADFQPLDFRRIAERFLRHHGYEAHACATEDEARGRVSELVARGRWPCFFFDSDTTGEKSVEEFTMAGERLLLDRYREIGVIRWMRPEAARLDRFLDRVEGMRAAGRWSREELLDELKALVPELAHRETGAFLDSRM